MILPLTPKLTSWISILSKHKCIFLYYCIINNARKIVSIIRQTNICNWISKIGQIIKNSNIISKTGCWIGCPPASSHWLEIQRYSQWKKKFFNTYFQTLNSCFSKCHAIKYIFRLNTPKFFRKAGNIHEIVNQPQ